MKDAVQEMLKNCLRWVSLKPAVAALLLVVLASANSFNMPCLANCASTAQAVQMQTDMSEMSADCDMEDGDMSCCGGSNQMSCCTQPQSKTDLASSIGLRELSLHNFAVVFPTASTQPAMEYGTTLALSRAAAAEHRLVSTPASKLYIVNRQLLI